MEQPEQAGTPAALPRSDAARGLALPLLVQLRWLLVAGESGLLLLAAWWFRPALPYTPMWAIVATQALSNLALARGEAPRFERWLPAVLVLDTFLLTGLLALSGGPHNPFTALYVVHVALAAVAVTARGTAGIAALSAACYGSLFYWHVPQPLWQGAGGHGGDHVEAHLVGMWLALAVVAAVIAFFIARLTQQLAETRALAARNERLASLTTLAAGTAHELGSPLGTIAVAAREIERGSEGPVREDARLIREEVQRCREILDRMSGSASGPDDTSRALRLEEVVEELRAALGERGPRLVASLPATVPVLFAPPRAVHQALLALVRNALDTSSDDPVELRVTQGDAQITFTVSDRGAGMSEAVLAHAEEPFFTTKEPGEGTGLGLYVVRLIAERLGGSLRLRSAQGQGTDATLSLPQRAAVSGMSAVPAPKLLIVDDDERLRERLLRAFAARGLDVRGAASADEALTIAKGEPPTHAVLDLRMPGRSGLELLDELRGAIPALRAVVLTGYGSIATALASVRSGAVDYLAKPADADQILSALGIGVTAQEASAAAGAIETPSLERVEWEHIQRVLSDCGGNISRAASVLGLHRRTLQRKLATYPPRR